LNSEKLEINNLSIFTHENFEQLNKVSKYSNIFRKSYEMHSKEENTVESKVL
jgi:hypothetical protein